MRRYAIIPIICLAGCVTSPVYFPGLHTTAPLSSKGSLSASYARKAPDGHEIHVSMLLTDRWFIGGGYSESDDGVLENSQFDLRFGRVTRDSNWQVQQSLGFTEGDGESASAGLWDLFRYEGAPFKAFGGYSRLYVQQATTRTFGWLELGASARVSGVRVTGYRRFAGTMKTNNAIGEPYNRDTTFSGRLSGIFAEPSLYLGVNYRGIRVTPQLAFAMPLGPTAFGAIPAEIGIIFAVDSDILKR